VFRVNPKIKASKNDNFQAFLERVNFMFSLFLPLFIIRKNFRFSSSFIFPLFIKYDIEAKIKDQSRQFFSVFNP